MSPEQPMTGSEDRPVEHIPADPTTAVDWLVMLGGPVIWINHFMVVYLAGEAACVPTPTDQFRLFGTDVLVLVTVIATVVAAVACVGVAWAARRRMRRRTEEDFDHYGIDMASAGFLLAIGGLVGVIAVGMPVTYLSPLC